MLKLFQKKKKQKSENLDQFIAGFQLPSFPATVMSVLSMLRDADISMKAIAQTVQVDPGINVRVLTMVNSAAFGLSSKISNIQHAITLLGKSRLEAIVLSLAVKDTLPKLRVNGHDMKSFWLAAARRAALARAIARHLHPQTQSEAFTAGLLQDMAIPFLAKYKGMQYGRVLSDWDADESTKLEELEKASLGFDHQQIGAMVAQKWKLPDYLIESIASHHFDPDRSEADPAVKIVSRLKTHTDHTSFDEMVHLCCTKFGFSKHEITDIVKKAFDDAEDFSQMLQ